MRNVVLLVVPSTGSRLVTRIFGAHGWNMGGPLDPGNELKELRAVMRGLYPGDYAHMKKKYPPGVPDELLATFPDEPWVVKVNAVSLDVWRELDPLYVRLRRNTQSTVNSLRDHGKMATSYNIMEDVVDFMERCLDEAEGPEILIDDVMAGDLSSLKAAIEAAGGVMDEGVVNALIDRSQWRH